MSKLHTHRKHNLADTPAQLWHGAARSRARRSTLAASVPVLAMILAGAGLTVPLRPADAASSAGCEGGGFAVLSGASVLASGAGDHTISVANLGAPLQIKGKYVEFTVVPPSFGIENWLFTGAANPLDITGGRRTVVWERKTPDHRGMILTGNALAEIGDDDIVLERSGPGLDMKIQAKDCANGGIFQMEVERDDGTTTRFTHVLKPGVFYFDNPNFRAREGDKVQFDAGQDGIDVQTLTIAPRINVANTLSAKFVGRDSPQVATRLQESSCSNQIRKRDGATFDAVRHCGRVSRWDVASGGRMGWVTGEDATEVAPPASNCVRRCQAQNRVRGGAVVLGFPFPAPQNLQPALPMPFP